MYFKKRLTDIILALLGAIFVVSLLFVVVLNNRTQTELFWENQQEKLSLITEKCASDIDTWAKMHKTIVQGLASEITTTRFNSVAEYEDYLEIVAALNADILLAYIMFDDGTLHLNGESTVIDLTGKEFEEWYWAGRACNGEIIFSEPCIDEVTGGLVVSCITNITMPDGREGIAGLDIELEDLNNHINHLNPSQNGGAWTASPRGRVITYIDEALLPKIIDGKTIYTTAEQVIEQVTVLEVNNKYIDKGIEISKIIDYDEVIKYEAITTVSTTGWMLGVNIPLSDYNVEINAVIKDQIPIIVISILMSIISIIFAFTLITGAKRQQKLQNEIELAHIASKTKGEFLSRMSHEIRTPMNAIIGMARIADNTNDIPKLRYCLSAIQSSSAHLLGIINDILDMSKIEAGKLELYVAPLNIEKVLMKICNLMLDKTEQKHQQLIISMGRDMGMNYVGDDLRLSQVITNLLSNAVKFTPDGGRIALSVYEVRREGENTVLRFEITDTGIGMTEEQLGRLFNSFEQADNSISRRFGGTGLGLAIAKNIVEKMNGKIWAESKVGVGSKFTFEVMLKTMPRDFKKRLFGSIAPSKIRVLIADSDTISRNHFKTITEHLGVVVDEAESGIIAVKMAENACHEGKPYDAIFVDYEMRDNNGIEIIRNMDPMVDRNTLIIAASFLTWNKIQAQCEKVGVKKFVNKPLFPSGIIATINDVKGTICDDNDDNKTKESIDLSHLQVLLAEDVEINREIFIGLLEDTGINIDVAENGEQAVETFKNNEDKYDIIIMDIQMPEMDGYEATRIIRSLGSEKSQQIPIVAMTANAFKEDIEECIASGMNDHLSKPIDEKAVIDKIIKYCS